MSPQVTAAVIAASVGVLTVIATVAVQISGRRATSRDTQKALEEQHKQLDKTLAEQRTRTLNERFATAAGQLGDDKPPAVASAGSCDQAASPAPLLPAGSYQTSHAPVMSPASRPSARPRHATAQ